MVRAKLWLRCAAMHDPVTPTLVQPAVVGWEAKRRRTIFANQKGTFPARNASPIYFKF